MSAPASFLKSSEIVLAVFMLAVLAVAAYLNFAFLDLGNTSGDSGEDLVSASTFFTNYRANWEEMRREEIQNLDAIIAVEGDEYSEARANAISQKQKIVELMETELLLESLLKAKGYSDFVVTIGVDSQNVNVIAAKESLTLQDTAIIYNTIVEELGVSPDYVKILSI